MVSVAAEITLGGDMSLPLLKDPSLMQTGWKKILDPVVANQIIKGLAIKDIVLDASVPRTIQTTLNRMQQGWFLIDNMANSVIWRTQPFNSVTLTLESSADTTISIWVF